MDTHGLSCAGGCNCLLQFRARLVFRQVALPQSSIRCRLSVKSIDGIPDNGVTDSSAVDVQLVGSTGHAGQRESGDVIPVHVLSRDHLVFRQAVLGALEHLFPYLGRVQIEEGALVVVGAHPHEGRVLVVPHQGEVDRPAVLSDVTAHERLVVAGDLPGTEEGVHAPQGGVRAGEDDESGGVHAQSVDHHLVHPAGFGPEAIKDGLV
mmetsp:Transcript_21336/g.45618  ORF Transcript_21336/g.45618 Transcript_21336/m.45618 type:complete len:207 (-) Transcript_21336:226-846(-)